MCVSTEACGTIERTRLRSLRSAGVLRDGHASGDKDVKRHEAARARLAGAQRVERDAVAARVFGKQLADLVPARRANRRVEQSRNRAPQIKPTPVQMMYRHASAMSGSSSSHPVANTSGHARDHADRSPHVVMRCLPSACQRNALVAASRALQYQRHRRLIRRCCRADTQSRMAVSSGCGWMSRALPWENAGRGEHDQRAFDGLRRRYSARVAILVPSSGGPLQPQHGTASSAAARFTKDSERIGQQPHRAVSHPASVERDRGEAPHRDSQA